MATKKENLTTLTDAGMDGFTLADSAEDLDFAAQLVLADLASDDPVVDRRKGV